MKTIVFVHGLFMNDLSWNAWKVFFEEKGYTCIVPTYPYHKGIPSELRTNIPVELSKLELKDIVAYYKAIISELDVKPILIGHSMGGLIVQLLINQELGAKGICIDSAPPQGIFSFKWSFIKANLSTINPFKGNSPCLPSIEWFHYAFCNTMSLEECKEIYEKAVVPESRNIPRSSTTKQGKIDFKKAHVPLLFIAGEKDNIVPASLNRKNANAYKSKGSTVDFKEFLGRSHAICEQENWEEIADYILNWVE